MSKTIIRHCTTYEPNDGIIKEPRENLLMQIRKGIHLKKIDSTESKNIISTNEVFKLIYQ